MVIIFNTVYMEKAKNSGVQLLQKKNGYKKFDYTEFFWCFLSIKYCSLKCFCHSSKYNLS